MHRNSDYRPQLTALAQTGLALIFATSGISKAANVEATKKALAAFGFKNDLGKLSLTIPTLEVALCISIVHSKARRTASFAGTCVLAAFTVVLYRSVRRGDTHECNCFGSIAKSHVSMNLVGRNFALILLGLAASLRQENSSPLKASLDGFNDLRYSHLVAEGMIALMIVIAATQPTAKDRLDLVLAARDNQWQIGSKLPDFNVNVAAGISRRWNDISSHGKSSMLLFVASGCRSCHSLLSDNNDFHSSTPNVLFVVRNKGDEELIARLPSERVIVQSDRELADLFAIRSTPAAMIFDSSGRVASTLLQGSRAIIERIEAIDLAGVE